MADTKISALTSVVTPAGTDEFPVNQGLVSKKLTLDQVKTFGNTAPVFAAGSASANTWPKLTAGTVLTAAEAGAIEFDGDIFYLTPYGSGGRGASEAIHFHRQDANFVLQNIGTAQRLFGAGTNGALTLPVGTYMFETLYALTSMSATSGNSQFTLTGTAALANVMMLANGTDNPTGVATTLTGSYATSAAGLPASQHNAGTSAQQASLIVGTFKVTAAGTVIPSITLATAAAASVIAGSFFRCWKISPNSVATVGPWS